MPLIDDIQRLASKQYLELMATLEDSRSIGDYVSLYGRQDIEERNQTYEVQTYMPGWMAIGDDGGGKAILMKLDGSDAVYRCGVGALGSIAPETIAESLVDWVSLECPLDSDDELDD